MPAKRLGNHVTAAAKGDPVYRYGFSITPSDDENLPTWAKAVYVGETGDLVVLLWNSDPDDPITLKAVPAGTLLPLGLKRVLASGTTAQSLVGLI